jgi:hypothetical protein
MSTLGSQNSLNSGLNMFSCVRKLPTMYVYVVHTSISLGKLIFPKTLQNLESQNVVLYYSSLSVLSTHVSALEPYDKHWVSRNVVCPNPVEACFFGECQTCKFGKIYQLVLPEELEEEEVQVVLWQKTHNERLGAYQFQKVSQKQSLNGLLNVRSYIP